jgi:hypothetical protein
MYLCAWSGCPSPPSHQNRFGRPPAASRRHCRKVTVGASRANGESERSSNFHCRLKRIGVIDRGSHHHNPAALARGIPIDERERMGWRKTTIDEGRKVFRAEPSRRLPPVAGIWTGRPLSTVRAGPKDDPSGFEA